MYRMSIFTSWRLEVGFTLQYGTDEIQLDIEQFMAGGGMFE